jgi:hypothetical protein
MHSLSEVEAAAELGVALGTPVEAAAARKS